MLAKRYRLKEWEVKRVISKGTPLFSWSLVCKIRKNYKNISRFAIVIGNKNTKSAVLRNKYRRFFYTITEKFSKNSGNDCVFLCKKWYFLKKDSHALVQFESDIKKLLGKSF